MSSSEKAPLLGQGGSGGGSSYYFLNTPDKSGGKTSVTRDGHGGQVQETIPEGADPEEFAPRILGTKSPSIARTPSMMAAKPVKTSWFEKILNRRHSEAVSAANQAPLKQRKAPIKVEPKVFFANERTFLAWMHISIILAGASIAILAFAEEENPGSQIYGIIMLPVAVAFIVYSMFQYAKRAYMIRNKHPGPYEDTVGPAVLGVILMLSIVCQFALKLYSMSYGS